MRKSDVLKPLLILFQNTLLFGMVPTNTEVFYFCTVYDNAGKTDFSKDYWNPKRKLDVTTHFLGINEQK